MATTNNPDRVRFDESALRSEQDVNNTLYGIGVRRAKIKLWQLRCKMLIDAVKRFVQTKIDALTNQNANAAVQIDQYLRHRADEFKAPNPRSKVLTFGKIGWRRMPKKADFDAEEEAALIAAMRGLGNVSRKASPNPEQDYDEYKAALEAVKVEITGDLFMFRAVVEELEKNGLCDQVNLSIRKGPFKNLPEETLKKLGVELSGDDIPFYEPDSKSVKEHAGVPAEVAPIAAPTLETIGSSLKAFDEEAT